MSLVVSTVDVWRFQTVSDAGGGENVVPGMVYGGLECTIGFPDRDSVSREETGAGARSGPGPLTRADRVVFIDPWDGVSVTILVSDEIRPNPIVGWLPEALQVVGVRPYYDGAAGELQLDVEDVG